MAISWKEMNELQPRVMKLLYNSIEKDRLSHAYLFEGKKEQASLMPRCFLRKAFLPRGRRGALRELPKL